LTFRQTAIKIVKGNSFSWTEPGSTASEEDWLKSALVGDDPLAEVIRPKREQQGRRRFKEKKIDTKGSNISSRIGLEE